MNGSLNKLKLYEQRTRLRSVSERRWLYTINFTAEMSTYEVHELLEKANGCHKGDV